MSPTPVISRLLNLERLFEKKSHFFLGPRQTGKSFLIAQSLKGARVYDLLDTFIYLALNQHPQRLGEELTTKDRIVVIDEIQWLPLVLNEIHRLIEQRGIRFLLTGSSARKLRQGGVNLLGGRARTKFLHSLTARETDYVSGESLTFWKSTSGFEVDFILGDHTAVEVKARDNIAANDLKSLKALVEERKLKRYLCVSLEPRRRQVGDVTVLPIKDFLANPWDETYT
jgi:predicted AAA+ superfamily ATPase